MLLDHPIFSETCYEQSLDLPLYCNQANHLFTIWAKNVDIGSVLLRPWSWLTEAVWPENQVSQGS